MSTLQLETSPPLYTPRKSSDSASPTITYHHSIVPLYLPIPNLVNSAAGGAHYSGAPVSDDEDEEVISPSSGEPTSSVQRDEIFRDRIMADLKELYCCRPSKEIFERTWRRDAVFEVSLMVFIIRLHNTLIRLGPFGQVRGLRAVRRSGASLRVMIVCSVKLTLSHLTVVCHGG